MLRHYVMQAAKGDKIRLRDGGGERGTIVDIRDLSLIIRLEGSHNTVRLPEQAVTNLSLAARKAWASMPARKVGRPKGTKTVDRLSVTLRIDRDLWKRFVAEERKGRIHDRTGVVNAWFREKLDAMQEGDR